MLPAVELIVKEPITIELIVKESIALVPIRIESTLIEFNLIL
jgi:hypothetical protein